MRAPPATTTSTWRAFTATVRGWTVNSDADDLEGEASGRLHQGQPRARRAGERPGDRDDGAEDGDRAGSTNPWHSHASPHGVYVLEGTLNTHQGQYGAGSFVWFPEVGIMEHGATQDEDCTFLFITNTTFDIHFVGDDSDPEAPKV